jgi:chemotaxis protein histidine kinase CheA
MIDAAGGAIDVTSEPGKGTRFMIRVPLYIASRQQPAIPA